jgi:pilus assembly protein Flp/PilA
MKKSMRKIVLSFLKCQGGVTAIEYGLIASLVALTIIAAATRIGSTELNGTFAKVNAAF